jgi:pyrimidine-specific ribonucleoside hydrolase
MILRGMDFYLRGKSRGKKFHDPLAACCALDNDIGIWAQVRLYRERGEWGSVLDPESPIRIIVSYDHERFLQILSGGETA